MTEAPEPEYPTLETITAMLVRDKSEQDRTRLIVKIGAGVAMLLLAAVAFFGWKLNDGVNHIKSVQADGVTRGQTLVALAKDAKVSSDVLLCAVAGSDLPEADQDAALKACLAARGVDPDALVALTPPPSRRP